MRKSPLVGIGLGLSLALAHFSPALAHAIILSAAPTPNGFYPADDPPTQVAITFSEEVVPVFSVIRVFDQSGTAVDKGDTHAVNPQNTTLAVSLKPLPSGVYTVAWEVLSTVDGHLSNGGYAFGVGVAQFAALIEPTSTVPGPTPASLAARWLTLTGQVLLLGGFAFRFFVWLPALDTSHDEETQLDLAMAHQAIRVGWIALGLIGLGLIATLLAQQTLMPTKFGTWLGTRFGEMWAVRFWLSAALAFGLADLGVGLKEEGRQGLNGWAWWAGLMLSAALGLTATLTSHSAALQGAGTGWSSWPALVNDGIHMLAAAVWAGGLVQLCLATRLTRTLPGEARVKNNLNLIVNFSRLAAVAVGLLLVSGGYLAWQHVGTWAALFETPYGLTLLLKLGLALPAFAIASLNLFLIKPRFAAAVSMPKSDHTVIQRRFNLLVLGEAGLVLAIVAAASGLTDLQRGRDALLLEQQARAIFSQTVADLQVALTIEPARWAQTNTIEVYLFDAHGEPVDTGEASLRLTFLDQTFGPSHIVLEPRGGGRYLARGNYFTLGGSWKVEAAIRRANAADAFATFQLETGVDGVIRPLSPAPTFAGRLARWFAQGGGWLTGGALILFALGWVIPAVLATRSKVDFALLLLPSLIAMGVGVSQIVETMSGPPVAPSGDPEALAWLAESDTAMNQLNSVQLLVTTRGDKESRVVLTETIAFQAPNLFHDVLSNGSENIAQGFMYYYRQQGAPLWQAVRQNEAFVFPKFDFSRKAVSARLGQIEEVNGRRTQKVMFTIYILRNPVTFVRWIDVETQFVLKETMDAPGHHMVSIYHDYNAPVVIRLPAPSEIGPTPTVTLP